MKLKKYWIAIQIRQDEKYDAFVVSATELDNIYTKLSGIPNIMSANVFNTKKAATVTVREWVRGFRSDGVYLWDTMPDGSPAPF